MWNNKVPMHYLHNNTSQNAWHLFKPNLKKPESCKDWMIYKCAIAKLSKNVFQCDIAFIKDMFKRDDESTWFENGCEMSILNRFLYPSPLYIMIEFADLICYNGLFDGHAVLALTVCWIWFYCRLIVITYSGCWIAFDASTFTGLLHNQIMTGNKQIRTKRF